MTDQFVNRRKAIKRLCTGAGVIGGTQLALTNSSHAIDPTPSTIGNALAPLVFSTYADAVRANSDATLMPGQIVDILGFDNPGDGGGFRGIVEVENMPTLPGGGSIRPLASVLDVRMFGSTGTPEESTATLQRAVNYSSASHHAVLLPVRLDIIEPIILERNSGIHGLGIGFRSGIRPLDCPALRIDGNLIENGWIFNVSLRDFTIWGDKVKSKFDYAMHVNQCYRSEFSNIMLRGYRASKKHTQSIVKIEGKQNSVVFNRLHILGTEKMNSGCALKIANSPQGGKVHFSHADFENIETGVEILPGAIAEFFSPYLERLSVGMEIYPGVRSAYVNGGIIRMSSRKSIGIHLKNGTFENNEHIALIGTTFTGTREKYKYAGIHADDIVWSNSNPITIQAIDQKSISISPVIKQFSTL